MYILYRVQIGQKETAPRMLWHGRVSAKLVYDVGFALPYLSNG